MNFNTNDEYDRWYDWVQGESILDDYYGNEIKKEVEKEDGMPKM